MSHVYVPGQWMSHFHGLRAFFSFFSLFNPPLLCMQVRLSVQPFSPAQGSGGFRLHQQAHHPRANQTDHPHPQQGESHAHRAISGH